MAKPNRAARRALMREQRLQQAQANAPVLKPLMDSFQQATAKVELLKQKTPKSLWPTSWHEE